MVPFKPRKCTPGERTTRLAAPAGADARARATASATVRTVMREDDDAPAWLAVAIDASWLGST
jgi:hypothetical protein